MTERNSHHYHSKRRSLEITADSSNHKLKSNCSPRVAENEFDLNSDGYVAILCHRGTHSVFVLHVVLRC